jgi:hypothetical protein
MDVIDRLTPPQRTSVSILKKDGLVYLGAANMTATLHDNGNVEVNEQGLTRILFSDLECFIRGQLLNETVQ